VAVSSPRTIKISSVLGQRLAKRALVHNAQAIRDPHRKVIVRRHTVSRQELFNEFNSSGLSFRGQCSTAYQQLERGVRGQARINFGDFIAPGLHLAPGATASYTGGNGVFILAENQGEIPQARLGPRGARQAVAGSPNQYSLCLACFTGVSRTWSVSMDLEVGVKVPIPEIEFGEAFSFGLKAKAFGRIEAGYKGNYIYLTCQAPQTFNSDRGWDDFKNAVTDILMSPVKSSLKSEVVKYIQDLSPQTGIDAKLKRFFLGPNITRNTLIGKLNQIVADNEVDERVTSRIAGYISRLEAYSPDPDDEQHRATTFLKLWGHKGNIGAGVGAELAMESNFMGKKGGPGLRTKGLGIDGSIKRTSYRLQVQQPNRQFRTQDTIITYKQANLTRAVVELEIELELCGITPWGGIEAIKERSHTLLNSMSYQSTVLYWGDEDNQGARGQDFDWLAKVQSTFAAIDARYGRSRMSDSRKFAAVRDLGTKVLACASLDEAVAALRAGLADPKSMINRSRKLFSSKTQTSKDIEDLIATLEGAAPAHRIHAMPGSGWAFGESILVVSVHKLYQLAGAGQAVKLNAYLTALACRLRVSVNQMSTFFADQDVQEIIGSLLLDPGFQPDAVLIEANFAMATGHEVPTRGGEAQDLLKAFGPYPSTPDHDNRQLQAIRLRYRIADSISEDKDRFTLGVKFNESKVGIALAEAERAGSQGIVDLAVKWYDHAHHLIQSAAKTLRLPNGSFAPTPKSYYDHAGTVPPVLLLCQ
jgi:hypothetical protein